MRRQTGCLWALVLGPLALVLAGGAAAFYVAAVAAYPRLPRPAEVGRICAQLVVDSGLHWTALVLLSGLAVLVSGAVLVAGSRAWRRGRRQRAILGALSAGAAETVDGVTILPVRQPLAFTVGYARPQVYISAGLRARLSRDELQAVLAHEQHHRRCRHPLLRAILEVLRDGFFFAPVVGHGCRTLLEHQELAADRAALQLPGGRRALAGALAKHLEAAEHPGAPFGEGRDGGQALARRIEALTAASGSRPSVSGAQWMLSLATLAVPAALLIFAVEPLANWHTVITCAA